MRVIITLDRYDGSQSQSKDVNMENIPMSQLVMYMTEADVASVTITKAQDVRKMVEKMNHE